MLTEFLGWWAGQMRDLMPSRLLRGPAQTDALLAAPDGAPGEVRSILLSQRRQGSEAFLGRFAPDDAGLARLRAAAGAKAKGGVTVRVPDSWLLQREVALPLAAEREPKRVLHYEMDRLTPFGSDAVFWDCAVARRDKARGKLHLLLYFVPKPALAAVLDALERAGVPASALEAATAQGVRGIPLAHGADENGGPRTGALRIACAALAAAALLLPVLRQSVELGAADERIAALKPDTDQADALRRRIAGGGEGADVVAAEQSRLGDALQVVAAVTDLLPDDTFLTELSLHQGKLGIAGQSVAAAKLIAALSASPVLRNPSFVAPVTRIEGGQADQFSIRAEIAP